MLRPPQLAVTFDESDGYDDDVDVDYSPVFGGLNRRELSQLERLASFDPRGLSEDDLSMLEGLPRWGLYHDHDRWAGGMPEWCGAGICDCDGPCACVRADLSQEQREWLVNVREAALDEQRRRARLRYPPAPRPVDSRSVVRDLPRARPVAVRPRERRPRRSRVRALARSPGRPDSSDDDPPLAGLRRRCPRCGGLLRPLLPSPHWTCDPCARALWERMIQHELGRVLAEAERILRGPA